VCSQIDDGGGFPFGACLVPVRERLVSTPGFARNFHGGSFNESHFGCHVPSPTLINSPQDLTKALVEASRYRSSPPQTYRFGGPFSAHTWMFRPLYRIPSRPPVRPSGPVSDDVAPSESPAASDVIVASESQKAVEDAAGLRVWGDSKPTFVLVAAGFGGCRLKQRCDSSAR
jgi:hypothetical protein